MGLHGLTSYTRFCQISVQNVTKLSEELMNLTSSELREKVRQIRVLNFIVVKRLCDMMWNFFPCLSLFVLLVLIVIVYAFGDKHISSVSSLGKFSLLFLFLFVFCFSDVLTKLNVFVCSNNWATMTPLVFRSVSKACLRQGGRFNEVWRKPNAETQY